MTPASRIGRAPKILLAFRTDEPFDKVQTPEFHMLDGTVARIEVLATGQQFVAFGIHPDTKAPYHWPECSPLDVPLHGCRRSRRSGARRSSPPPRRICARSAATAPPIAARSSARAARSQGSSGTRRRHASWSRRPSATSRTTICPMTTGSRSGSRSTPRWAPRGATCGKAGRRKLKRTTRLTRPRNGTASQACAASPSAHCSGWRGRTAGERRSRGPPKSNASADGPRRLRARG